MADKPDITQILAAVAQDQDGAQDRLFSLVHTELRNQARRQLGGHGRNGGTLQPTALVNEAYLRLFRNEPPAYENRRHFFFAAARAMRDVAVEHARRSGAKRRGGGRRRVDLDADLLPDQAQLGLLLDVDAALTELREHDGGCADVVLLRYFGGLTIAQTAEALDIAEARVRREWEYARAWLRRRLEDEVT